MRTYENKDELKNEINKSFAKYISEFNDIPEHLKDKRIDEVDRTPAENLAMLDKSMAEAEAGGFVTKSIEELEAYE